MSPIFSKALNEVTAGDLAALVTEQHPETETVEYKEALPSKKGQDDWYLGGEKIGEYARNQLLAEIVAFANAHGGHLLIGIEESADHPRRATQIKPVPRCADLAERLKLQIRDCVEPTIPVVGVRGIVVDESGGGVIVVRVPESRSAPHRLATTRECYVRHADRSETMTMRQIQDLTIQRTRGLEGIEARFAERKRQFREWIGGSKTEEGGTVGCRATLLPTSEIYVENLYQNQTLFPHLQTFKIQVNGGSAEAFLPISPLQERPIVRGVRRVDEFLNPGVIQEMHSNGLVELCFRDSTEPPRLFVTWIMGTLCNALVMADKFRKGAGAPDVEYALELEIAGTSATVPIFSTARYKQSQAVGTPATSPCLYPRMSVGNLDVEFSRLVEISLRDIWNSCGLAFNERVSRVSAVSA